MKSPSNTLASRLDRACFYVAVVGVVAFVAVAAVEHVINSSLDPATHEISEYVHGRDGQLMTFGFVCWALSLAAMSWTVSSRAGAWFLAAAVGLACVGIALTASFATETSAGRLPPGAVLTATGRLHDVGSGLATIALLMAAVASLATFAVGKFRRNVGLLLAIAISSDVALLAIGPSVAGVRQRVLVGCACAWQLIVLRTIAARAG